MNTRTKIIALLIAAIVIALLILRTSGYSPLAQDTGITVSYSCDAGKTITAVYHQGEKKPLPAPGQPPMPSGSVALVFSDGRAMTLIQTISADGVRYASADDSLVFWSKGNGALVLEDGQEKAYMGCIKVAPEPVGENLSVAYANSVKGFSIRLPTGYRIDESYAYQEFGPGKDISGIKFTIPESVSAGTNLSSDTAVTVEEIPNTENCTSDLFLDRVLMAKDIVDGNVTYSVASSTGAGAGNRYEETVYALPGTDPCIAVRYFVHYGAIQNYPPGAVREFNEKSLLAEFDAIRRTLVVR